MKTKNFLFFIFLSIVTNYSYSQVSLEWASRYDYNNDGNYDEATDLVADNSGNVYVTGYSDDDYSTIKYNSSGDSLWVRRYNGPGNGNDEANAITVDNSGNVYITGSSSGLSSGLDYATIKYNSSGVQQWVARYNGPGDNDDESFSIAVDASGNVYVTGESDGSGTSSDYATIKYNSAGVFVWVTRYNGVANGADREPCLVLDGSGNVYVTGSSTISGSTRDYATVKYNSSGAELWIRTYNGTGNNNDAPNDITADGSGNVYVTGLSLGVPASNFDYATIKYNSSGDSTWTKRYNGSGNGYDEAVSIAVDVSGNVYITGTSYSGSPNNNDLATIKYNSSGAFQWDRRYNGSLVNDRDEVAKSIALDNSGNIYITGWSEGTNSDYDYATIKYNAGGVQQWVERYTGVNAGLGDEPSSIFVDDLNNVYVAGGSAGLSENQDFVTLKYRTNPYALITCFIEGFYNSSSNKMISDTVRIILRSSAAPYNIIDSSRSKMDSVGVGRYYFSNVVNAVNYYIVLRHRNSIETWSNFGYSFSAGVLVYNFSNTAGKAYGSNQIQIDASPIRFGIYSGDVNQDGVVDATDAGAIDNDAFNFVTGYVSTDLNGDETIDASDAAIVDNNAANFVSKITP